MILQLYKTMDFKAITLIIDDQLMDVSEIPFPAVTIFSSFPHLAKLWHPELQSLDDFDVFDELHITEKGNFRPDMRQYEGMAHPVSRMAAISMVTGRYFDTAYTTRFRLNRTDHEKYLVEEVKKFSKVDWFRNQNGSFGKYFSAPFAETLTSRAIAFAFNLLDFDEMFDTQE